MKIQVRNGPMLFMGLTRRQWQVVHLVGQGYGYKEVAARLGLSLDTVRVYSSNLHMEAGVYATTHGDFVLFCHRISEMIYS